MASQVRTKEESSQPSSLALFYLVLYNLSLCVGWAAVLVVVVKYLTDGALEGKRCPGLYSRTEIFLLVSQSAAVLEVIHAALGIVKSSVMLTLFQVASRQFVLWGCIVGVPGVSDHIGVVLVLLAWSVTEIIRYTYYATSLLGMSVYLLTWCRYTFFFILYPIGVLGELMILFTALPIVKAGQLYSLYLPNKYNWSFDYYFVMCIFIFMYLPIFPQLYGHMIGQRKKVLSAIKLKTE